MQKKTGFITVSGLAMLMLAGCSSSDGAPREKFEVLESVLPRITAPDVAASDVDQCVSGNNGFAMDLYGQLATQTDGNLFYSPYSISVALSMVYGGARGNTATQMKSALHFDLSKPLLFETFNALDLALTSRGANAQGKDGKPFELHIVNDTWGQTGYGFLDDYLNLLSQFYGANLKTLNFDSAPKEARSAINSYIANETAKRITELLPNGSISSLTRLVLTNAIYFNAAWAVEFDTAQTRPMPFTSLDGGNNDVPMMHQTESMGYMAGEKFDAVGLNYDGNEISMVLVLPDENAFNTVESSLTAEMIHSIFTKLVETTVHLSLPSFTSKTDFSLKDTLIALGVTDAFSDSADFSGIDGSRTLMIYNVYHSTFVEVDESGTEAAAATAVVMNDRGAVDEDAVEMNFNRPFIYFIRDNQTNTILFAGRVTKL
ncbi:MAG: serpin family protein [Deltaproteobacteria bacterium]|nr:serpin family protein [Deltaproteobacteria bacterium]